MCCVKSRECRFPINSVPEREKNDQFYLGSFFFSFFKKSGMRKISSFLLKPLDISSFVASFCGRINELMHMKY